MSYCKERDFHNSTSPTDFYEFAIPSVVSVIYHVDFRLHANVGMVAGCYSGTCLYSQHHNSFISLGGVS